MALSFFTSLPACAEHGRHIKWLSAKIIKKDNGFVVFINESGVSYVIYQRVKVSKDDTQSPETTPKPVLSHYARIDLELVGARLECNIF